MGFVNFSKWIELKEQAPAPGAKAPAPGQAQFKDNNAQVDREIKQIMASTMGKPKKIQQAALMAKAKQMAMNPNIKPDQIKKIQDAMGEDDAQNPAQK